MQLIVINSLNRRIERQQEYRDELNEKNQEAIKLLGDFGYEEEELTDDIDDNTDAIKRNKKAYNEWLKALSETVKLQKEESDEAWDWAIDNANSYLQILIDNNAEQEENEKEHQARLNQIAEDGEKERFENAKKWFEESIKKEEENREAIQTVSDGIISIYDEQYNQLRVNKEKELSAVGDNARKREEIERKYAKKEQQLAIGRALMTAAEVVLNAALTKPFIPAGLAASVMASLLAAVQIKTIRSQKFATGILDLQGRGTGTSDSIPAMLSRGESVMTAKETKDYYPYLKAIKEGVLPRVDVSMGGHSTVNNLHYDNSKEIKELRNIGRLLKGRPQEQEYLQGGFRVIKRGNTTTRISIN